MNGGVFDDDCAVAGDQIELSPSDYTILLDVEEAATGLMHLGGDTPVLVAFLKCSVMPKGSGSESYTMSIMCELRLLGAIADRIEQLVRDTAMALLPEVT